MPTDGKYEMPSNRREHTHVYLCWEETKIMYYLNICHLWNLHTLKEKEERLINAIVYFLQLATTSSLSMLSIAFVELKLSLVLVACGPRWCLTPPGRAIPVVKWYQRTIKPAASIRHVACSVGNRRSKEKYWNGAPSIRTPWNYLRTPIVTPLLLVLVKLVYYRLNWFVCCLQSRLVHSQALQCPCHRQMKRIVGERGRGRRRDGVSGWSLSQRGYCLGLRKDEEGGRTVEGREGGRE